MQPKDENIDAFWDIRDMVPRRTAPKRPPVRAHRRRPISLDAVQETEFQNSTPPCCASGKGKSGARIPSELRFIQNVKIPPWPSDFGFYAKFRRDALRYFEKSPIPNANMYIFSRICRSMSR